MTFNTYGATNHPALLLIPGLGVTHELFLPLVRYVRDNLNGHLNCAYGLSLGGKILSRILERNEIVIDHAIMDAAPLLPLPRWSVDPLRYYQSANVWTCYHWCRCGCGTRSRER